MTPEGNLSQWMHQLKTAYTVYFNRRHQVVGHLFQGRFKSTVIETEKYLLEVSRYLHFNPVRGVVLGQGTPMRSGLQTPLNPSRVGAGRTGSIVARWKRG